MTPANATLACMPKIRHAAYGKEPDIFTDIYAEDINIAVWQRSLPNTLQQNVSALLASNPSLQLAMTVTPESTFEKMNDVLADTNSHELSQNIAELVNMFCYLFELQRVGLRLTALNRAMCPRFHIDRVPCRLVTTFQGIATEWLHHDSVNREKLGHGSNGKPDSESGLYQNPDDIQQLSCGDVALLKGELWHNNENAGLVHRSPALSDNTQRLLLTLDFSH